MAKITKTDLVNELSLHTALTDVTKGNIKKVLEDLFSGIKDKIESGEKVFIAGFGTFYKAEKTKDGKGTGEFAPRFKAAKAFKDSTNV